MIQGAVVVTSVRPVATIQSVAAGTREIHLVAPGSVAISYQVSPAIRLDDLQPGDRVQLTLTEELTIYVGAGPADARVLSVDRSYRLVTLRYPDGLDETLKMPRAARLEQFDAGDAVTIRPREVIALAKKAR